MAHEVLTVADQHVHAAEGVLGVMVVEPVAERPVPQRAQRCSCCRVDLVTLQHGDVHDRQPSVGCQPHVPISARIRGGTWKIRWCGDGEDDA